MKILKVVLLSCRLFCVDQGMLAKTKIAAVMLGYKPDTTACGETVTTR